MSSQQSNIDPDEAHDLAEEAGETAELEDVVPHATDSEAAADDASVDEQLAQAQDTIKDYWDQMMRLRAEIDNNRKRADRDLENAHKYALKSFIEELLPVVDSMEMGQSAAEADNATLENIREGSTLTMNMFFQVLQKNMFIVRIEPSRILSRVALSASAALWPISMLSTTGRSSSIKPLSAYLCAFSMSRSARFRLFSISARRRIIWSQ